MKRAAILLLALLLGGSRTAAARVVIHAAKAGETAESIAAEYYGNRSLALFILEGNGLNRAAPFRAGQKIRIPTAFRYRIRRGDTLEALALRFLDDKRRAPFLALFSGMRTTDKLREGMDLLIPFQHVHSAEAPESLQSVARAFYGDPAKAKLLADYNFRGSPMLARGERLLVPIAHVRVRAVRLQTAAPAQTQSKAVAAERGGLLAAAPDSEAQRREAELATRVGARLNQAERSYKDGGFTDVPAVLDKLLTDEDPSEAQLAEIFRLKAFAYVALGEDELAVNAFREVLARKPDVTLDEATVSPKIRAALDQARMAPKP